MSRPDVALNHECPVSDTPMNRRTCLRIAVSLPVSGTYSYGVPDPLERLAGVGRRVMIPFGNRRVTGFVLQRVSSPPEEDLKPILEVIDEEPLFTERMVPFLEWMAQYYMHPIGKVIQSILPGGLNANPLKTAVLTDEGRQALADAGMPPEELGLLKWVEEHPGHRLPGPFATFLALRKKGWVDIHENGKRPEVGPLLRKIVRPGEGKDLRSLLERKGAVRTARNEAAFLEAIFHSGGMLLTEVSARFDNGAYLVRKWVDRGVVACTSGPVYRNPDGRCIPPPPRPESLYDQQDAALKRIRAAMDRGGFSAFLLFGVTGSGKTEVYYRAVEHAISLGRQVLLMVPEISLAHYIGGLFRTRLGDRVAIYHSGLGRGERYDQWMRTVRGEADLVIGARSALFAPLPRLGLIIVDEEHDTAYKQEMTPRYQARDLAVVRAKLESAVVVLGSGTPSVQSYYNTVRARYKLLSMPDRIEKRSLPAIEVVDLKPREGGREEQAILSPSLREAIRETLSAGDQTILFLNRRGFHRLFLCPSCGKSIRCPNCEVALTHHLEADRLTCHYCGFSSGTKVACPDCKRATLKAYGFGTEKLEHELRDLFPDARVARMDTDSTRRKGQAAGILRRFNDREIDIIVGTQMIAKGYDFPGVTLVGVVAADLSLGFPDFRAGERTFQLLSQVAGRSGRGTRGGRVIIQTFNSDHYAIRTAVAHDYRGLFEKELALREQLGYPPYAHLVCLRLKGNSKDRTEKAAHHMGAALRAVLAGWPKRGGDIQVLGPIEAPLSKLKGKYRWQLLLKGRQASLLQHLLAKVEERSKRQLNAEGVQLIVDVDPYQMI